ncbi:hypothetical protein N7520_002516 [Penicillium odoratum]|uniref:uncharacterized protein n=1 Tax=Penicillium odoratum TaxID=1167516 RepID=UPI002547369E|nr:uncharacterized protein N7520_002516 [Penicillium odoratum]KAJ5771987.1 hypothetical protein N7520_002516 [Penicillium odoratum]
MVVKGRRIGAAVSPRAIHPAPTITTPQLCVNRATQSRLNPLLLLTETLKPRQPVVHSESDPCGYPDSYSHRSMNRGYSTQTEDDKVWCTTNRCTSFNADQNHVWTLTKAGTVSTMTSADGINARAVFIRWQSFDFATAAAISTESSVSKSTTQSTASNKSLGSPTATSQAGIST